MVSSSLIQPDWTFALWSALTLLCAFGFWADKTKVGRNISGAAIILATAMALSNFNILPKTSDTYNVVWSVLIPLAIPLLLLKADIRKVISETKGMLLAFILGAIGTISGALIGYMVLDLGEHSAKIVGIFTASYIGGSLNMAAVTQALNLDPSVATASVAANNVVGVMYLAFLALMPSIALMRKYYNYTLDTQPTVIPQNEEEESANPINLVHIGIALGLSFAICAVGKFMANAFNVGGYSIMFITALTILIANIFPKQLKELCGDYEIGIFLMYLFFAAVGISADVLAMLENALVIAAFVVFVIAGHAIIIFSFSKFLKLDLMEVIIASNACAAGPASAAALAAGKGRMDLVAPGVLLGVFGYTLANFIGVGIAVGLGS